MPPLVALKPHRYDGRLVRKGERYTVQSDSDATLLTAIGYSRHDAPVSESKAQAVEPAPEPAPVQKPQSEPASAPEPEPSVVEEPEQEPEGDPPSETPKPRRYRRKDMTATEG